MSTGDSRVSEDEIPESVRKTIQGLREIAGNHSNEDIYGALKECNMDAHETAKMLEYLGTFQEVKTKRSRRKENANSRGFANYGGTSDTSRQGSRGGRGTYSSYSDSASGRSLGNQTQSGVNRSTKARNNATSDVRKSSTVAAIGRTSISNGSLSHGKVLQLTAHGAADLPKNSSVVVDTKLGVALPQPTLDVESPLVSRPISVPALEGTLSTLPKIDPGKAASNSINAPSSMIPTSASGVSSSASDPVLEAPLNSRIPGSVGAIGFDLSHKLDGSEFSLQVDGGSLNFRLQSDHDSKTMLPGATDPSKVGANALSPAAGEVTTETHRRPGIIIPDSLQVPEAYRNRFVFGTIDASSIVGVKDSNFLDGEKRRSLGDDDETAAQSSPSSQNESEALQEEEYLDHPQSPARISVNVLPSEENVLSDAAQEYEHLNQEMTLPPYQHSAVQSDPTYSYGFVPPMLSSQLVEAAGPEGQARHVSQLSNFASGNSLALSSSALTPPVSQPAGVLQTTSVATSPRSVPVFRQPYHNFFPYGPYVSQFYMPPTVHPVIGHGGFPQPPSTGSALEYPLPQYKPGSTTGNPTQAGIPSTFGSYGLPPVGYISNPAMASGSSTNIENLPVQQSHPKDDHGYVTGQQMEDSAAWIPGAGQDIPTLQVSSYYKFPPQGQHVSFPGPYHPAHTMAAPTGAQPLIHQPPAMAGYVEKMASLSAAYQQQQQQLLQQQHA